jgi:hypothetical protein
MEKGGGQGWAGLNFFRFAFCSKSTINQSRITFELELELELELVSCFLFFQTVILFADAVPHHHPRHATQHGRVKSWC